MLTNLNIGSNSILLQPRSERADFIGKPRSKYYRGLTIVVECLKSLVHQAMREFVVAREMRFQDSFSDHSRQSEKLGFKLAKQLTSCLLEPCDRSPNLFHRQINPWQLVCLR